MLGGFHPRALVAVAVAVVDGGGRRDDDGGGEVRAIQGVRYLDCAWSPSWYFVKGYVWANYTLKKFEGGQVPSN